MDERNAARRVDPSRGLLRLAWCPRMDGSAPGNRKIGSALFDTVTALGKFAHRISRMSGGVVGYRRSMGNIRNSTNNVGFRLRL